jgi:hypothetical protein
LEASLSERRASGGRKTLSCERNAAIIVDYILSYPLDKVPDQDEETLNR